MKKNGRIFTAVLTAAVLILGAGLFPIIQVFPAFASEELLQESKASPSEAVKESEAEPGTSASSGEQYDEEGILLDGAIADDASKAEPDASYVIEETEEGEPLRAEPKEEVFDLSDLIYASSDELLLAYLEREEKEEQETALSGNALTAYTYIKKVLEAVAAGEEERAEAEIPLSVLDMEEEWVPETELDLSGPVCSYDEASGKYAADENILEEAVSEMGKRLGADPELIAAALAENCSYDLYWSAKSLYFSGPAFRYRIVVENGEACAEFFCCEDDDAGEFVYGFSVDPLYTALAEEPSFYADTSKTGKAASGEMLSVILEQELLSAAPAAALLPRIVVQPEDFFGHPGDKAVFSVEAEGENLNYRWQKSTDGGKTWRGCTSEESDSPEYSFVIQRGDIGKLYRCVVISGSENVKSENAALLEKGAVRILTQPEDICAKPGDTAVFTVEAEGDDLSYRWQSSANGGSTWKNCTAEAADTPEYRFEVQDMNNGWMYRCVVSDSSSSVTSEAAAVFLEGLEFTVTFSVNGDTTLFAPVSITSGETYFSAEGWPGPLGGFTYLWYTDRGMSESARITEDTVALLTKDIVLYGKTASEGTMDEGDIWWKLDGTTLTFYGTGTIDSTFEGNLSFDTVVIDDGVSGIAADAFRGCKNIRTIEIADTVAEIGEYAFSGCTGLSAVTLPRAMEIVSAGVFSDCTALAEVFIPDNVTRIGDGAFRNCTSLKNMKKKGS